MRVRIRLRSAASVSSMDFRSVISLDIPNVPISSPSRLVKGILVVDTHVLFPEFHVSFSTLPTIGLPVAIISSSSFRASFACSKLKSSKSVFPKTSSWEVKPNFLT